MISFKNTYSKLPGDFYRKATPESFASPQLIAFNYDLAKELEINLERASEERLAQVFSGQELLPGSEPIAQAYAGHQFGHGVPQLGDGRALLLGECHGFDIQLKGSGRTPFSRRGDGRSALGPVLREYIVSEAMHALGVPTTRALCAVTTGENVLRQFGEEPGGVFTRVADSHIRVGTFQYFAFREDLKSLKVLLDYTLSRHYPHLQSIEKLEDRCMALLKSLTHKQSILIAKWSSFGFIHGVMNTDNFSLAGITIDYGPCAFMDEFKRQKVFSSIDSHGRYSFYNQTDIAKWNILRLADCLLPLIHENQDKAIARVESELIDVFDEFDHKRLMLWAQKVGIDDYKSSDATLVQDLLSLLEKYHLDFTLSFKELPKLFNREVSFFDEFSDFEQWASRWRERVCDIKSMDRCNPLYIPRNHQIERAIHMAYEGDFSHFHKMNEVLKNPFTFQEGQEEFSLAPSPEERVYQTFCGT